MTPNPARRSERSRIAILAAALELVREVGYGKLTVEAIAARAGVGKQTIYRWWPSKAAVIFDAFLQHNQTPAAGEVVLPDTGDFAADMRLVLHATVAEFNDPTFASAYRALNTDVQDDPELAEQMLARVLKPTLEAVGERFRAAQRAGQIAGGVDLEVAVEALFGPIYYRWLLRTAPLTTGYADAVLEQLLRGWQAYRP
ncbi:TetR/AcrR family transcriptional regulator [Nonomuraea soli]|uniref:AcrR family transcriptional regulator n=1 Tax=Nonomuraea soli TaxID=1032476 RepID=A0A7W0HUQ5_9ACTN|nr:TetR/AcrR family transcriptional regulator [Nonomuraea soli]MBA2896408.1 AcrR family transcriptional regulator [Nonomuraea soli]